MWHKWRIIIRNAISNALIIYNLCAALDIRLDVNRRRIVSIF